MGVTRFYEIYCDDEDQGRACDTSAAAMEPYLGDLRAHLRKHGWLTGAGGDWCPNHRPDRKHEEPASG